MIVIEILFAALFCYLALATVYLLVIAIAGRFGKLPVYRMRDLKKKIAVIIPSYKEDHIIVDTAMQAASHDYPRERFSVIVAADKLQPATVAALRAIPVRVIELDVNMKSRSVNAAMSSIINEDFEIAMILDADNIMAPGCLEKINDAFQSGCLAMQCHRTAKNQHTPVALLDAMSEEININLFRRGPAVLGISAAPIGSGMAFATGLLREIFNLEHILNNPGEDREIDIQLMKKRIPMQFIDGAYVYDEKVASAAVFEKQRVRWLEAQVHHLKRFFQDDMKDCPKTAVYWNKLYQNILLPRLLFIMLFGVLFLGILLQWLTGLRIFTPDPLWWLVLMITYAATLFISIPKRFYNSKTLKAILQVPLLMISMVKAMLKMKSNRKEFLHTEKTYKNEGK